MTITYSQTCINARLQGVVSTIDASGAGFLILLENSTVICTIQLAVPCATVNGGVLTFSGTLLDTATGTGSVTAGRITDALGNIVVSGLNAGIPGSTADIIISNGLNTTAVSSGQVVQVLAAQITGS